MAGVLMVPLLPVYAVLVPDWVSILIVAVAVVLALLALVLMVARVRSGSASEGGPPARYLDPMLIISAVVVILLALAALR